jgi:phosphoenolpyruvate---glycerone phosphotransferase subunit DhaM
MIGLVVVSHSSMAAEGIVEVATEMGGDARLVAAGGGPDGGIGTSTPTIQKAILAADDGDGVVILVDLGSAVMNAELAVETLEAEGEAVDVRIADAPILEGALNAAVAATSSTATLEEVVDRAEEAREYRKLG